MLGSEASSTVFKLRKQSKKVTVVCMSLVCTETGGSEVNPEHEPHIMKGGITAEMQVRESGGVGVGIKSDVWR